MTPSRIRPGKGKRFALWVLIALGASIATSTIEKQVQIRMRILAERWEIFE